MTRVSDNTGRELADSVGYHASGQVAQAQMGPVLESRAYDNAQRLSSLEAGNVLGLSFEYDGVGNVTEINDDRNALDMLTGGGEIFESEVLLHPLEAPLDEDSVEWAERYHRGKGLTGGGVPFHEGGCGLSVVRLEDGCYLNLDRGTYTERSTFRSFDEWYRRVVREEFARRYGLPTMSESHGRA